MTIPPDRRRRRFLQQASFAVAGSQLGGLIPVVSAGTTNQAPSTSAPQRSAASDVIVETTAGRVRGTVQGGVATFKGIPYGATTAGKNRFLPPRKPLAWSGVRAATTFGHDAPQSPTAGRYDWVRLINFLTFPGGQAEDCLVLNVWSPSPTRDARRPVLVSFHGGGYNNGTGSNVLYNGQPLAAFGDVVVVTLNHRLGCLGYLNLADVGAPSEFAEAGVAGMMDCVSALEWVRDNIAAFGGDPGNVMIFGQSGGGGKVACLLTMPSARGLFHKAAIQSAGNPLRGRTREASSRVTELMLAQLEFSRKRIPELQRVPVEMLTAVEAVLSARDPTQVFGPVIDNAILPRHPFEPDAPAISADVPVIVSTTLNDESDAVEDVDLDEAALRRNVAQIAPNQADEIVAAYRRAFPTYSPFLLLGTMRTDRRRRRNAYLLADRKAALRRAPVYMYTLEWPSPAYGGRYGATHVTDVPLVFHNTHDQEILGNGSDARVMADQLASSWVAFARTGNPNHPGIPHWPAYTIGKRETMIFNLTSRVENDPWGELRAVWNGASG